MLEYGNDIDIDNDGVYKQHSRIEGNPPTYRSHRAKPSKNSGTYGKCPSSLSRCYSEGDVLMVLNASHLLNSVDNNSIDTIKDGSLCSKFTGNKCLVDVTNENAPYNKYKDR